MSPSPQTPSFAKEGGVPLVLSAPSGTGKTTILKRLMEKLPDIQFTVSHTTRSPRPGEIEGKNYFFISETQFKEKVEQGDFLEWAKVSSNFYGTAFDSIRDLQKRGRDIIIELDVQGAESLRKLNFPGVFVFILPPSIEELAARLNNRGTESPDKINQRIETGLREIRQCLSYDFIIVNREVEESVDNLISIVKAEKCRAAHFIPPSKDIETLLNMEASD